MQTNVTNLPWQDKPENSKKVVWRYAKNPIITRNAALNANSILNSAVVPFKDRFAGVFRVDDTARHMDIRKGISADGINWQIEDKPIEFISVTDKLPESEYKYDPRVIWLEDRYYIVWCNGYHGPGLGLGYTYDFEKFYQMENIFMPYNRNGVLFPRKIKGKYSLLQRPSDAGHTPFGDIFYSQSPDLVYWGEHRHVMGPCYTGSSWQSTKVGAGPVPIETEDGWLMLYHGVLTSCNGFVYSMGAALLDLEEPWKVIRRSKSYLLAPQTLYECVGDVPNVVFPCAALTDQSTGRVAIYYGGADTVVNLAFTTVKDILDFLKQNSL